MRKKLFMLSLAAALGLSGCQTPEASSDSDVFRAKSPGEDLAQAIVDQTGTSESRYETGEEIKLLLGKGENRLNIQAHFPAAAAAPGTLYMQADTSLDETKLRQFLDPQGEVLDITQQYLEEEAEKNRQADDRSIAAGEGKAVYHLKSIGDPDFHVVLTDGNRTVTCSDQFFASYRDQALFERCLSSYEKNETDEDAAFSVQAATDLLMKKLSALGIEEIYLRTTHFNETGGFGFYELEFSPSFGGVPTALDFGSNTLEEIKPRGYAWVSPEGVADVTLWQYCMKIADTEEGRTCDFDHVVELLTFYLEEGQLSCREDAVLSHIEFVYYPTPRGDRVRLVPAWNIFMSLDEYVDYHGSVCHNIYLNALTGELIEVRQ